MTNEKVFRPLCIEPALLGVHFVDALFGSEVFFSDGQWYNRPLRIPVGSLTFPDFDCNAVWKTMKVLTEAFVELDVKLPFFGIPTLSSALNIAVNLLGEEILAAIPEEPENALHDLQVINDTICFLHEWFRKVLPPEQLQPVVSFQRTQPPGYGQICGCTTHLVSGPTYSDMIAPLDAKALSVYPNGGMIHLCGSHTQHVDTWHDMSELKAVQINDRAAEDLEVYFRKLRPDQIIYLVPCENMTKEKAMSITKSRRLVIIGQG